MSGIFSRVQSARPGRSVFNLSYEKKFTCDMGQLVPIMCDECVPGDIFKIGNQSVIRFQPLVAPAMHEINVYVHYYFVPFRILWDDWENFITRGVSGDYSVPLPRWNPANTTKGSLWDFMGFPTGIVPTGRLPEDFPRRAYNLVFNEYYRDETLVPEVLETNETILNRSWEKDYFTSSLPWQQRGTAPALPISGLGTAQWPNTAFATGTGGTSYENMVLTSATTTDARLKGTNTTARNNLEEFFKLNVVDLSNAQTFDVADLRLVFQIQKWMERNARGGARYTEFLKVHFSESPRDERLQRPEYIGGSKSPIIISEVLQTSSTDATTPQGNLAGHGIGVNQSFCANYKAQEYGLIIGIMSVMPRTSYQQGIDRQWLRQTPFDFYFPEFANLSEQAIERVELYASNVEAENTTLFGYQGRYDEMRFKRNMVCSDMRDTFDYWHLGRKFSTPPLLNSSFITCDPATTKRIFAVPSEPGLIVNFGNLIKAIRPLPVQSTPGLIDHN